VPTGCRPHRRRRHDGGRPHRQVGEERGVRSIDLELHAHRPRGADAPDVVVGARPDEVGLVRRVVREDLAFEREHDRLRVERRAVVKTHAGAKIEGPQRAVLADRPARRQVRLRLQPACREANQPTVDLLGDLQRFDVAGAGGIQADGVGRTRHYQPVGRQAGGRRRPTAGGRRRQHEENRNPHREVPPIRIRIASCSAPSTRRRSAATAGYCSGKTRMIGSADSRRRTSRFGLPGRPARTSRSSTKR
jgi:hypothetical protein